MHPQRIFFFLAEIMCLFLYSKPSNIFEIISHPCCLVLNVSNHEFCHVAYVLNTLFKVQVSNHLVGLVCDFMISYLSKKLLCHLFFTRER